ncbi:MAG TPA: hypothetical protein VLB84_15620, partial [Bacteroidia bacterium]|nr:hypothetical protein [Bacteroidia bacterium]
MDYYRGETFSLIKEPKTRAEGIKNMVKLTSAMVLMETTADELINLMLGRETKLSDLAVDNILKVIGLSSWNVTEARKEGVGSAFWNMVTPPTTIADDISKDITKGEINKTIKNIPLVGQLMYWWFGDQKKS